MATNGSQCAHIWAQQSKPQGKGYGAISFNGDTLFSYAEPIARLVERDGIRAALIRNRHFSITTSTHQSLARSAASHLMQFNLYAIGAHEVRSDEVQGDYRQRLEALTLEACRARTGFRKEYKARRAAELAAEANNCARFFKWKWRLAVPVFSDEFIAKAKAAAAAEAAKQRKAREERHRAEAILMAAAVSDWQAGRTASVPWRCPETLLRVNGDRVETSRGAHVPVSHARRLWPLILRHKADGTRYQRNGHTVHVGEFAIDSIEADGTIVAGCHTIKFNQVEHVARQLGLAT